MQRILCLDVGTKRIGVAVSDPFGQTAQGVTVLQRQTFPKDCEKIYKLAQEYTVAKIILGLPLNLDEEEGPQAKKIRFFVEGLQKFLLQKKADIILELWEESFSSRDAEEILLQADVSRQKRKKVIDKLAASLILQNYLDNHGK
ncbi:MAG: Holliday junction resolvase RuvX [Deltaproteobacteria bacterium]|nr:Holliday junction resolvase RuvX [Deltaproteobacteria bacterium]